LNENGNEASHTESSTTKKEKKKHRGWAPTKEDKTEAAHMHKSDVLELIARASQVNDQSSSQASSSLYARLLSDACGTP
jgi:hypothetical protein